MSKPITDQEYLSKSQYKDSSNLNARVVLHQRFGSAPISLHRWVFDQFTLPNDAKILELGCGFGALWIQNIERIPEDWNLTLTDLSDGMLKQASENLAALTPQITFRNVDAQSIPYPDHTFDAVIANHMLYHVPDRPKAYAEIGRVLKPGGKFYAALNNKNNMKAIKDIEQEFGLIRNASIGDANAIANIESVGNELPSWFEIIECRIYDNALVVTEAEPIINYILSGFGSIDIDQTKRAELAKALQSRINTDGAIRIENQVGLLIASNKA